MDQNMLKTSWKQRILILIVAAILLGSTVAIYISIVLSNSASSGLSADADLTEIQTAYEEKYTEYNNLAAEVGTQYFDEFSSYRSRVSAYNAETANTSGVTKTDLKIGDGEEITSESEGYGAYYIGWCADESVFDSSFDNFDSPSALNPPLIIKQDYMIAGWYAGVDGMRIGGIREISIPGDLAYGEDQEICGGTNSPLKFVIMTTEVSEEMSKLTDEVSELYAQLMAAYYGSNTGVSAE